jgi:hypothetical protein
MTNEELFKYIKTNLDTADEYYEKITMGNISSELKRCSLYASYPKKYSYQIIGINPGGLEASESKSNETLAMDVIKKYDFNELREYRDSTEDKYNHRWNKYFEFAGQKHEIENNNVFLSNIIPFKSANINVLKKYVNRREIFKFGWEKILKKDITQIIKTETIFATASVFDFIVEYEKIQIEDKYKDKLLPGGKDKRPFYTSFVNNLILNGFMIKNFVRVPHFSYYIPNKEMVDYIFKRLI